MTQRRILLIQLRQLGDILLTTPCTQVIRHHEPDALISFLSHKMGRMVLEQNPYLDEIFYYDEKSGLRDSFNLIRQLRARHFDVVFDFMNNPRSALLSLASGSGQRIGFKSARQICYNMTVPKGNSADYLVREKFRLLAAAGIVADDERLILPWGEGELGPLRSLLVENPAFREASIRVILSPTHRRANRKWPAQRYVALADHLSVAWGATVLWIWGPGGERAEVDALRQQCQQQTYLAPATTFREMAALIANSDLFVGNSNGPSHVAVAADTCSLQLHGHTDARTWCPMNQKHRAVQSSEFGRVDATLNAISLEDVVGRLEEFKPTIFAEAEMRKKSPVRISWNC